MLWGRNDLEQKMLLNLHKKGWFVERTCRLPYAYTYLMYILSNRSYGLTVTDAEEHSKNNCKVLARLLFHHLSSVYYSQLLL